MSNDNYPAGVTDAHPYFNPNEHSVTVSCTSDEALVLPNYWVQLRLNEILNITYRLDPNSTVATDLVAKIDEVLAESLTLSREGEYECQWEGTLDLPHSEEAEWDCPRCGVTQTTDTVPEDRDPDEGWDSRHDD